MAGPLAGFRVVELGFWVAGPAAAGILGDWGASVIKIEQPGGDPYRGAYMGGFSNAPFEMDNRGKRSIVLDLKQPAARTAADQLLAQADVFVTNLRPDALEELGLSYACVHTAHPRLIYCHVTGYGVSGPFRNRPAYDGGAFWSHAGIGATVTPQGAGLARQRSGMGDHTTGANAAGAICAALLARARTGEGQLVTVSLLRSGIYVMGWDMSMALVHGVTVQAGDRRRSQNPISGPFRAADDRWFWLLLLQSDRHWPDLCRALQAPELEQDLRAASFQARAANSPWLIDELDHRFAARPRTYWAEAFDQEGVWWAPVNTVNEVIDDPIAAAAGAFPPAEQPDGAFVRRVASPADFSATPWSPAGHAPELGEHTEEILLELGYDWEAISSLTHSARAS